MIIKSILDLCSHSKIPALILNFVRELFTWALIHCKIGLKNTL